MTDKPYQTKHEVRILAADIQKRFPNEWEIDRLANRINSLRWNDPSDPETTELQLQMRPRIHRLFNNVIGKDCELYEFPNDPKLYWTGAYWE